MSGLFDDDDDYLEYLYLTGDEDDRDELETWFGKAEADAIIRENTGRSKYDDKRPTTIRATHHRNRVS